MDLWVFTSSSLLHSGGGGGVCVRVLGLCVPFSPEAEPFGSASGITLARVRACERETHTSRCWLFLALHIVSTD